MIRNVIAHFNEIRERRKQGAAAGVIGNNEGQFIEYMTKCFPWIMIFAEMIVEKFGKMI